MLPTELNGADMFPLVASDNDEHRTLIGISAQGNVILLQTAAHFQNAAFNMSLLQLVTGATQVPNGV